VASLLVVYNLAGFPFPNSQENAKQLAPLPQLNYEIAVTVKNVEVIIRGKDGHWITGLKPSNFQIYEDGFPKKITNFHEVASPQPSVVPKTEARPGKPEIQPSATIPEAVQNRIVLFFDNAHLQPVNRNLIIKKLTTFLARNFQSGTTNQAMVVLLDRRLNIVQSFTSEIPLLLSAVEGIRDQASDALYRARTWDDVQQEIIRMASQATSAGDDGSYQQAVSYVHGYVEEELNQIDLSLQSLGSLVNYLGGIKGRKLLIYASDGLPLNPAEEVFSFISRLFPSMSAETESLRYDVTRLFNQFIASCNAQDVSVYSLQAEKYNLLASSADKTNWSVKAEGLRPITPGTAPQNDGLEIVSRETGGSVITAKRDLASGFETIEDDLSHYYSLGYTSDAAADDSYHSINVKVFDVGEDCVLRFRKGYLKSSVEEIIKSRVVARLFLPQIDNPLGVRVQILPTQKLPLELVKMSFKLLIPISRLSLQASGSESTGAIKVIAAMLDSKNLWSDPVELLQDIRIPHQDLEKAQASVFPYLVQLDVKPDRYVTSIAIHDVLGRQTSYLQVTRDLR
jgi:VWFA-related protein